MCQTFKLQGLAYSTTRSRKLSLALLWSTSRERQLSYTQDGAFDEGLVQRLVLVRESPGNPDLQRPSHFSEETSYI
jgi:hypothetical protein